MSAKSPRVSIGVPVYNGENYLAEALDALLGQTFHDLELIIADNASTDGTEAICRAYAARDERVRYVRHASNIGAARNFNLLVGLARGVYFKWAAHDDLCAPTFIERCVEVLDSNPAVVLCWPQGQIIDDGGRVLHTYKPRPSVASPQAYERLYHCMTMDPEAAVFGLIRLDALRETRLIGAYSSSDRILIGELALRGRCYEVPERLFFYRHHPQQSWRVYPGRHRYQAWFDPSRAAIRSFPHWRLLLEHYISISRVPQSLLQRARCYLYLAWWVRLNWRYLLNNLLLRDTPFEGLAFLQRLQFKR